MADDGYVLDYSVTATDPQVFTEPVVLSRSWICVPGEKMRADDCGTAIEGFAEALRANSEDVSPARLDAVIRELDCAVIEALHVERQQFFEPMFDSVRGLFPEGRPVYEQAGFRRENHIQICVRNRDCIRTKRERLDEIALRTKAARDDQSHVRAPALIEVTTRTSEGSQ